ncbi:ABC transporter substrate-binding protein [Pedococcus sp. 5OH_020]|uniref:ABC transporter substrate-binding protein n=1 Tax=Pedococcus sp. 5OH_020 TaxID=2989814 RepID=UPI0022E997CD|nr:sugar ABC transporter substrate-binding protein [Pedococcus sp. 5OH_020]
MGIQQLSRLRVVALGAVAAAVVPLAACGGGSGSSAGNGGKTTLRLVWWGNEDRAKATKSAIELFQKKHPNVTVQTEFSAYDAYFQKLSTQLAGGGAPDIVQIDRPNFGDYARRHVLKDLTPYVGKTIHTNDIDPKLLAAGKVQGQLYALPGGQLTQSLVYDPAAWKKAGVNPPPASGWTWDEFTATMKKLGASGTPGTTDFGWAIDWFEVWLAQQGKQTYTPDGKLGFTEADLAQFWGTLADLRKSKAVSAPSATTKMDGSMPNSAYVNGQAASEINYDSSLTAYITAKPGTAAAPLPSANGKTGMSALPTVTWGLTNRSKNADVAAQLIDFLVNDPEAGKILGATRGLPPNQSVRQSVAGSVSGPSKAVFDYESSVASLVTTEAPVWPVGSAEIKRNFQQVYDDVIFGKTSVQAGAKRVVDDAHQSLGG